MNPLARTLVGRLRSAQRGMVLLLSAASLSVMAALGVAMLGTPATLQTQMGQFQGGEQARLNAESGMNYARSLVRNGQGLSQIDGQSFSTGRGSFRLRLAEIDTFSFTLSARVGIDPGDDLPGVVLSAGQSLPRLNGTFSIAGVEYRYASYAADAGVMFGVERVDGTGGPITIPANAVLEAPGRLDLVSMGIFGSFERTLALPTWSLAAGPGTGGPGTGGPGTGGPGTGGPGTGGPGTGGPGTGVPGTGGPGTGGPGTGGPGTGGPGTGGPGTGGPGTGGPGTGGPGTGGPGTGDTDTGGPGTGGPDPVVPGAPLGCGPGTVPSDDLWKLTDHRYWGVRWNRIVGDDLWIPEHSGLWGWNWKRTLGASSWTSTPAPVPGPQARTGHSMVASVNREVNWDLWRGNPTYDNRYSVNNRDWGIWQASVRAALLLFGGTDGESVFDDLWKLVNAGGHYRWQRIETKPHWTSTGSAAPQARTGHSMAVGGGAELWLFGGTDGERYFDDLWRLVYEDGHYRWQRIETEPHWTSTGSAAPQARTGHSIVWVRSDVHGGGGLLLFGGTDGERYFDDLWKLSDESGIWRWRRIETKGLGLIDDGWVVTGAVPPARTGHSMINTVGLTGLYLSGGTDGERYFDDIWQLYEDVDRSYGRSNWSWFKIEPQRSWNSSDVPQARMGHSMAMGFRPWLFGGTDGERYFDDLWRQSNQSQYEWQRIEVKPHWIRDYGISTDKGVPQARTGHTMEFSWIEHSSGAWLFGGCRIE